MGGFVTGMLLMALAAAVLAGCWGWLVEKWLEDERERKDEERE